LILTRLLFPEAFGLMALVQVFMGGLQMFSDLGIQASIIQNSRGDDPDFLNTAWVMQIGRGIVLWLLACGLALPMANLYGEPMLAVLLPVVGLNALISGFNSTNMATANRHLVLGRLTAVELGAQALGIVVMVVLAFWLQSVWALVIGGLIATTAKMLSFHIVLPGIRNRFHWERAAVGQLLSFGKYIFLSTVAGFLILQSDRAVLGWYISIATLGVYNVGFFLGTVPFILGQAAGNKVIFPIYRMRPPSESAENRARAFKARRLVVAGILSITAVLAFSGIYLVDFLYDDRYAMAGPIVVLFSLTTIPQIVLGGYSMVLLAAGDSKRFFYLLGSTAVVQMIILFTSISWIGILGAALAPGLATMITYPIRISYMRRYKAWDAKADFGFLSLGFAVNGFFVWLYWDAISVLVGAT
jgi:O-antigen/teichoic acid export membrane protein